MAADIARIGIGQSVNSVVVVLGVGRIDGDQWDVSPVLAAFGTGRPGGVGFSDHGLGERLRNSVRVNGDQADRAFGLQRAEALHHNTGCQAVTNMRRHLDRNQVTINRAAGATGADRQSRGPFVFYRSGPVGRRHSADCEKCRARAAWPGRSA